MWIDVAGNLPAAMRVEVTWPDPDGVAATFTALPTADGPRPQDACRASRTRCRCT